MSNQKQPEPAAVAGPVCPKCKGSRVDISYNVTDGKTNRRHYVTCRTGEKCEYEAWIDDLTPLSPAPSAQPRPAEPSIMHTKDEAFKMWEAAQQYKVTSFNEWYERFFPAPSAQPKPETWPQHCHLCDTDMESPDDRTEWHGLGNCVPVCMVCMGSGIEPPKLAAPSTNNAVVELGRTDNFFRDVATIENVVRAASPQQGQGWVIPSADAVVKELGSGWQGFSLREASDLKFVVNRVLLAIRQCALPAPPAAAEQTKESK